ncbi:MAG: phasin family protein [Vicinamibacterales bacterium]
MKYYVPFEETVRQWRHDAMDAGQKVLWAGVGAAGMIGNTTSTLFNTLVEEGKRVQGSEADRLERVMTRTKASMQTAVDTAVDTVQQNLRQATKVALDRLGLPSQSEISALSARIEALTTKVEHLAARKGTDVRA